MIKFELQPHLANYLTGNIVNLIASDSNFLKSAEVRDVAFKMFVDIIDVYEGETKKHMIDAFKGKIMVAEVKNSIFGQVFSWITNDFIGSIAKVVISKIPKKIALNEVEGEHLYPVVSLFKDMYDYSGYCQ